MSAFTLPIHFTVFKLSLPSTMLLHVSVGQRTSLLIERHANGVEAAKENTGNTLLRDYEK